VIGGIEKRGGFPGLCSPLSQLRCAAALTKGRLDGQSIMGENAGTKPHPGTAILEQASSKVNKVGDRQDGKYDRNFRGFQLGRTKIVFLEEGFCVFRRQTRSAGSSVVLLHRHSILVPPLWPIDCPQRPFHSLFQPSPRRPILRPRKTQVDFTPFNSTKHRPLASCLLHLSLASCPQWYAIHVVSDGIASVDSNVFHRMFCAFWGHI